ncbi:MAG: tRNA lysidine(34) synthetase TilS [Clostridia bacterium]|nr:tRNA lysidine(34) synthetase TilS [Clostridia bacterium]
MINKVKAVIEKYNMLPEGSTVVVAVSGGSDSMVLLNVLNALKEEYSINLCAAHVNHGLRGENADRDERFVAEKCAEMNIELNILKADVSGKAKESGMSIEECGRKIRYDFFNSLGDNIIIATAHNLSDRAETFLFNFARGSALRGLCSIPAVRDNIIRPLIDCSKEEIISFCEENAVEYVTDETNSDVVYSRNRIRHNIVSQFKEINPSFEKSAMRCINSLNEDEMYLRSLACELAENLKKDGGYDTKKLLQSPVPILKRAVIKIVEENTGITPGYRSLERIIGLLKESGSLQINGGVTVRVRRGVLDFPSECDVTGDVSLEIQTVNIKETNNLQNFSNQDLEYFLDYDKIHGKIFARGRQAGDKITLVSRNCTKSLKKLFNELSVPPEKRDSVAVVADDNGLLILEGIGVDKRAAVTKETEKIMIVKIVR